MLRLKQIPRCLLALTLLLLAGCATYGPAKETSQHLHFLPWAQRQTQLQHTNNWTIHAAVSIIQGNNANIAHCSWQQHQNSFTVRIYGPLNLSSIVISGKPGAVTLTGTNQHKLAAKTPEALMLKELGWSLPISNLKYWIRGLPLSNSPYHASFDKLNHLTSLTQNGWNINYSNYIAISNIDLPTKVTLSFANIKIKIVINQWNIN